VPFPVIVVAFRGRGEMAEETFAPFCTVIVLNAVEYALELSGVRVPVLPLYLL